MLEAQTTQTLEAHNDSLAKRLADTTDELAQTEAVVRLEAKGNKELRRRIKKLKGQVREMKAHNDKLQGQLGSQVYRNRKLGWDVYEAECELEEAEDELLQAKECAEDYAEDWLLKAKENKKLKKQLQEMKIEKKVCCDRLDNEIMELVVAKWNLEKQMQDTKLEKKLCSDRLGNEIIELGDAKCNLEKQLQKLKDRVTATACWNDSRLACAGPTG